MRSIQRTTLQDDCVRTLARAAQAEGAGSRHERRSAARRFVARHRHDTSYLRWVLRSVAASSALAVTLLGLGAQTASAATPTFEARPTTATRYDPGFALQNYNSGPVLGDLDGDGDLDLVSGDWLAYYYYQENTGSATSPVFVHRVDAANPLDGFVGNWYNAKPALGDLDGDGDLDVIAGEYVGAFNYYENTGTSTTPIFTERFGAANPLDGQSSGAYHSTPTLGDLDGDGDLDLVAGEAYDGALTYFENTGSAASPVFVQRTGAANPLDSIAGFWPTPTLADVDDDGDLDLVIGSYLGTFDYYENTGNAASPVFVQRTGPANPLDGFDVSGNAGGRSAPTFGDLDGDGDLDLLSGTAFGDFAYFENTSAPAAVPVLMGPLSWLYAAMLSAAGFVGLKRAPARARVASSGPGDQST